MFVTGRAKKQISAHQIHRTMGTGSYETPWNMGEPSISTVARAASII
jgi:hypothetical protein